MLIVRLFLASCWALVALSWAFQVVLHSYQPRQQPTQQQVWAYLFDDNNGLPPSGFLTVAERRHLLTVKRLLNQVKWLTYGFSTVLLLLVYNSHQVYRSLLASVWLLGLGGCAVLLLDFRGFFIQLHGLLFDGNWLFAKDSGLIVAFPWAYFQKFALFCGLLGMGFLLGLCPLYRIGVKK
jgi:hypothetical protein